MDDIGSNEFEIEGVRLSLRPGDGGASIVSADLGPLAEDDAEALAGEMLEANFAFQGTAGATLSVDPATKHVFLRRRVWPDDSDDGSYHLSDYAPVRVLSPENMVAWLEKFSSALMRLRTQPTHDGLSEELV